MSKLYDLTYPQKSILLTEQFYQNTPVNNICGTVIINAKLDFSVFKKAMNYVVEKNESFRIRLSQKKNVIQQYVSDFKNFDVEIIDIKNKEEIEEIEKSLNRKAFNIFDSDLFEFKLFRFGDNTGGFVLNIHHIIADAWTLGLISRKIMRAYSNLMNNVIEENDVEISYINYISEEQKYIESSKFKKDKEYWDNLFSSLPLSASLPSDNPEISAAISSVGERLMFSISKSKMKLISDFCANNQITMFNFLVAVYSVYISKIINSNDFSIGTPIFNRTNFKEKNTMGMFVNIVPFRIELDKSNSFISFVNSIARNTISLLRHQKYPYQLTLEELRRKDSTIPNLYNIVMSYQLTKANNETDYDYNTRWSFNGCAADDLTIQFFDLDEEGILNIAYDFKKLKYSNNYIKNLHLRIMEMINQILENPEISIENIEIITSSEKDKILNEFNNTKYDYDKNENVIKAFQKNVQLYPEKIAIVCSGKKITYKELDKKSNSLANYLKINGAKEKGIIGIMVNRSLEMAVGLLGILKAGCEYLPIDPEYPKDRIEYMLEDSNSQILLTNNKTYDLLNLDAHLKIKKINIDLERELYLNNSSIESKINPSNLIYLIYTSGSTGKPKGVMLKHENIINFLNGTKNVIDFNSNKVMLSVTTIRFDIFVLEFWGGLTSGMTVVLADEIEQNSAKHLNRLCKENNVDMIQTTPSRYKAFLETEDIEFLKNMTDIMVGGEGLPKSLAQKIFEISNANFYNMYGPTETAVWSTIKKVKSKDNITIGTPIANTQCYILDKDKKLLPPYIPGELYIGGDCVSNGYLNREELTNEKFIQSPFDNKIIYNTNDLAYFNDNGELIHLGRTDFQVKIRGYRIELEEIENKIISIPEIVNAVVVANSDNKYLICYYVSKREMDSNEISSRLLQDLPNYMVPAVFYRIDEFPLTPNGKLDRKRLPKIELKKSNFPKCETETEKLLFKIISEVLKNDKIDINAPFMTIGLDSLGIIQAQTKLLQYNYVLNTQDFYKYNTIKNLAENIDNNIYTYKEHDAQVPTKFRHTFDEILSKINNKTSGDEIIGNVFITGANGFIGIHILHELLNTTSKKIYCLVRGKTTRNSEERLIEKYKFYFEEDISNLINDRIFVFDGTIVKENIGLSNKKLKILADNVQTVIHTAARVKHYGDYDEFHRINTEGTKNIADFALKNNMRLIHISSISVSGNYLVKQDNRNVEFSENNLYIGQNYTDNVYVHSKFEAEKIILEYMEKGLTAQIHRIGILAGRLSDGVFQMNIEDNAFYSRIKSMVILSCVSEDMLSQKIEFTPVDVCTKSIVSLAKNSIADNKIFHLYNHNFIEIKDIIECLNEFNKKIDIVSEKEFNEKIIEISKGKNAKYLLGIINDLDSKGAIISVNYNFSVNIKSEYTQKYLHLLKNDWNKTDTQYIKKLIKYMIQVNFI